MKQGPPDAIYNMVNKHAADPFPKKVNLGIGIYRDDNGKPIIMDVVRRAEKLVVE